MFVFAQDMVIRNWVKILLVSTTIPPFTTAKTKLGTKVLQFSFWSILLNYMPIHEKKECPNPIIISSNMGIGNLVKETFLSAPYINPHSHFQPPRKNVSASMRLCRRTYASTQTGNFLFFIFYFIFLHPCECSHASAPASLASTRTHWVPRGRMHASVRMLRFTHEVTWKRTLQCV
jgi:hypothetical protein